MRKIKHRITFWLFILMITTSSIIFYVVFKEVRNYSLELTQKHITMLEDSIFMNLRDKMLTGVTQDIYDVINQANTIKGIDQLKIYRNKKHFNISDNYPKIIEDTFQKKIQSHYEYTNNTIRYLQITTPIIATNECISCHINVKRGEVIGVFDFHYNLNNIDTSVTKLITNLKIISIFFILLTLFIVYLIVQNSTQAIEKLKNGFNTLLDDSINSTKLKATSNDEISDVINLFNAYLEKLEDDLKSDAKNFASGIINSQTNIIFATDSKYTIKTVNDSFLEFFHVKDINDFKEKYGEEIGTTFKEVASDNFISQQINGFYWYEYISNNPNKYFKVIIEQKNKEHIFHINTKEFILGNEIYKTVVLTDITDIEIAKEKFKNLLDNANQGFLYFNSDMEIGSEYSRQAKEIFRTELYKNDITELLYPNNFDEAEHLTNTLKSVLTLDSMRKDLIFSLLDSEFIIYNKTIKIEYKLLENNDFMLLLQDITEEKELNKKLKKEQQILKMVVETVTTIEQFEELRIDYENFTSNLESYKKVDNLYNLRREIHTFKGLFAQKEMLHVVQNLHDFETIIDQSIKEQHLDPVLIYTTGAILYSWLEEDIIILKEILGEEFFHKSEYLTIKQSRIEDIYNKLLPICNSTNEDSILHEVKELLHKDIKVYLKPYKHIVHNLAEKLNKHIHPLIINSENIFVPSQYKDFLNTIVHIFRNSLDHGIEPQEIRKIKNKPPLATISCTIKIENKHLIIIISDDGAGIDIDKIKQIALEKDLKSKKEIDKLSQDEISYLIFKDGFSTANNVTTLSGRGVGLASVKYEVEQLNGTIKINNRINKGVSFIFKIPYLF